MKPITLNRDRKKIIKIRGSRTSPSSKTSQQNSYSQIIENGNKVLENGCENSIVLIPANDSRSADEIRRIVNIGCKNNPSNHSNRTEIVERLHEIEDGNKERTLPSGGETRLIIANKRAPIEKQIEITNECQGTCDTMHSKVTIKSETRTTNSKNPGKNAASGRQPRRKMEKLQQTDLLNRRENEAQTV